MQQPETQNNRKIQEQLRRTRGRAGRRTVVSTKVTCDEQKELETAARREGKVLSEWAREALFERARKGKPEGAVFTELMALRLLLNGSLREIALGRQMTEAQYQALLVDVKKSKHQTAADVLAQYQPSAEGGN